MRGREWGGASLNDSSRTTERHGGALYKSEPFMPESMVCSGVPAHHKTTVFPACAEFALGSTKEGLRCPKDRLGDP